MSNQIFIESSGSNKNSINALLSDYMRGMQAALDKTNAEESGPLNHIMAGMKTSGMIYPDHLRDMPDYMKLYKLADLAAGPSTSEFEQAFAQIAEKFITDKAPILSQYMLGFQMLKKSEDDTRACGIFAYKLGSELIYIPVFFINGRLKGQDMMYIVSRDQFRPSDEKQVNLLLSRVPLEPGTTETRDRSDIYAPAGLAPTRTTYGAKLSSYEHIPQLDHKTAALGINLIFKTAAKNDPLNHASFRNMANDMLTDLFNNSYKATKIASAWDMKYPVFHSLMSEVYRGPSFDTLISKWEKKAELQRSLDKVTNSKFAELRAMLGEPKVASLPICRVYSIDDVSDFEFSLMKEAQVSKLYKEGYMVVDERPDLEHASVVTNGEQSLRNPTGPGKYSVFMVDGTTRDCIVLYNGGPNGEKDKEIYKVPYNDNTDNDYILVDIANKAMAVAGSTQIWTVKKYEKENYLEDLPDSVREDSDMLYSNEGGDAVYVGDDIGKRFNLVVTPSGMGWKGRFKKQSNDTYIVGWDDGILLKQPAKLKGFNTLSDWNSDRKVFGCDSDCIFKRYDSDNDKIQLGTSKLWELLFFDNLIPIKVQRATGASESYFVDDEAPKKYANALETLMVKHHLYQEDAEEMLKAADAVYIPHFNKSVNFKRTKIDVSNKLAAYGGAVPTDNLSVTFPQKPIGYDAIADVATEGEVELDDPIDALKPTKYYDKYMLERGLAKTDASLLDNPPQPNRNDMELAAQASQFGQKEFVNSQMLMTLLREVDTDSLLQDYIPTFEKCDDAYARILMQLYWRTDAFEEKFGQSQLEEFEEMLTNLFQQTGDFICYLRQRDVSPAPVLSMGTSTIEAEDQV